MQKASSSLGLPRAVQHLPLATGRSVWERKFAFFYPCSGGAQGPGCFESQASHCLPTRCVLPNMDGSPLCMEEIQLFGWAFNCFTEERCPITNMVTSTVFHFFLSLIISCGIWLWRENSRKSSHAVIKPMLKIKLESLTLFECATLNFVELIPYLGRKLTASCWSK